MNQETVFYVLKKGICYAPDFLINAGGLINVYSELKGYSQEKALDQTKVFIILH